MPITITPAERTTEVTKILCPQCKERLRSVVLLKDSKVDKLSFTCTRCKNIWNVKSE